VRPQLPPGPAVIVMNPEDDVTAEASALGWTGASRATRWTKGPERLTPSPSFAPPARCDAGRHRCVRRHRTGCGHGRGSCAPGAPSCRPVPWAPELSYVGCGAVLRRWDLNGVLPPAKVAEAIAELIAWPLRVTQERGGGVSRLVEMAPDAGSDFMLRGGPDDLGDQVFGSLTAGFAG